MASRGSESASLLAFSAKHLALVPDPPKLPVASVESSVKGDSSAVRCVNVYYGILKEAVRAGLC